MKLIPNWRKAWRMWSVRLNALGAATVAAAIASPDIWLAVSGFLPPRLALALLFTLFVGPIIARLIKQEKCHHARHPDH